MPESGSSAAPIMHRSDLTRDEWTRFRIACLKQNKTPREVTTYLLRTYADTHEPEQGNDRRKDK